MIQWGRNGNYQQKETFVNLMVEYIDNNYNVICTAFSDDTKEYYQTFTVVDSTSITNKSFRAMTYNSSQYTWEVAGFGWKTIGFWK